MPLHPFQNRREQKGMTDETKHAKDFTKGRKYKALTRISFGHERPAIEPGQHFNLDDDELAKKLLASNSITTDMKHEEPVNTAGGTNAGADEAQHLPAGQVQTRTAGEPAPRTASDVKGDAADEAMGEDKHTNTRAQRARGK
jgi:hypothetical protein